MSRAPHLLICVTGGIAAYKIAMVASHFVQTGALVDVAMTASALRFVGAPTFEGLTGRRVHTDLWHHPVESNQPLHIQLPSQADAILVAPASANALAQMAHGLADDLISTLLLVADIKKLVVAPAMNEAMWKHPATQHNIEVLQRRGVKLVGPENGWQACRTVGAGRMSEPDAIISAVAAMLPAA